MDSWTTPTGWVLLTIGQILLLVILLLLGVAYVVYADRKIFAGVQMRKGPNVVGPFGLLQSFADLIKFLVKEITIPAPADKSIFLLTPILGMVFAFMAWAVIPFAPGWVISNINIGVLYLLAISSLGVYVIIMAGWSSNSRYAFLGALRSAAQMISYEVSIGLVIVTVILLSGSTNLTAIVNRQIGGIFHWNLLGGGGVKDLPLALVMIPMTVIFFISALAETNRPPFDLPEAESELVAGYAVEYGSVLYMMIYLAETLNIMLMCVLVPILFLGGWDSPWPSRYLASWPPIMASLHSLLWLLLKAFAVFFMFAMVRAIVPRYRYDQLMRLGWKVFLPTSLVAIVIVSGWRVFTANL
ncbi:NADH-quinone oxidoreductase subunit NuoH [Phenylobacterium sp.]|uniref:NADH-quinone oxidoreductase subunit NuoH n=1 Tax=Phenylobacterium sp. TaxID=1871053 RepID=UPI0025F79A16|nr:NADH-quinone oxidoreductase subunit NuoH [Phenylobacterium sp.]MCA3713871.1 NADH-quinone oxidoreductase subunit NuoH [Phenylobacterium sp.]